MSRGRNWDREATRRRAEQHDPLQSGYAYVAERKPTTMRQRALIRSLRVELGITDESMPLLSREASALISELLSQKRRAA